MTAPGPQPIVDWRVTFQMVRPDDPARYMRAFDLVVPAVSRDAAWRVVDELSANIAAATLWQWRITLPTVARYPLTDRLATRLWNNDTQAVHPALLGDPDYAAATADEQAGLRITALARLDSLRGPWPTGGYTDAGEEVTEPDGRPLAPDPGPVVD
jgi:hypothetical protein